MIEKNSDNRQKIEELQKLIAFSRGKIEKLQNECQHNRVKHRLFKDIYAGQGGSSECIDCGKFISCFTAPPFLSNGLIEEKTWIEEK